MSTQTLTSPPLLEPKVETSDTLNVEKRSRFSSHLPPELWGHIFFYATGNPSHRGSDRYFTSHLGDNSGPTSYLDVTLCQLKIKRSLVLVCKLWQALALRYLYEVVFIWNRRMALRFHRTLVSSPAPGYGHWVRQLVLPILKPYEAWKKFRIINIISWCPNIELLAKPYRGIDNDRHFWEGSYNFPVPSSGLFTSLRHLCWTCTESIGLINPDALRLSTIIYRAPNLSSLSIRYYMEPLSGFLSLIRKTNALSTLTSLYLFSMYTDSTPFESCEFDMPNLAVVLATYKTLSSPHPTDPLHHSLLSAFGKQLRTIKLLHKREQITTSDDIRAILLHCPNLHTLSCEAAYTILPSGDNVLHKSLSVVTLRINDELVEWEQCMQMHFASLIGKAFPALRRVVLKGNWRWTLHEPRLRPLHSELLERGVSLEFADGTVFTVESHGAMLEAT